MKGDDFRFGTEHGLATLGPDMVRIRSMLDGLFIDWAESCGAAEMLFPPLMQVKDLSELDYFKNFPHLATAVSRIQPDKLESEYAAKAGIERIPGDHLAASDFVLPSAACYNAYLHLRGRQLDHPAVITTIASCYRNETEYRGLRRLWGFTMREIVCVGPKDAVQEHLRFFKARIQGLLKRLDLPFVIQTASDPFFQPQGAKAKMLSLFPTKEEFVYGGSLAFASLNLHRNFFGERCRIRTADGAAAYSGCVAFGIERWLHALLDRFQEPAVVIDTITGGRAARRP
jgi:seryl-tRNA synthetase